MARLDIYSGSVRKEERSHPTVRDWISDGEGNIRIRMKMDERETEWQGRASGSKKWEPLHEQKLTDLSQYYEPLGFGERTDELLVSKLHEGRAALWVRRSRAWSAASLAWLIPSASSGVANLTLCGFSIVT